MKLTLDSAPKSYCGCFLVFNIAFRISHFRLIWTFFWRTKEIAKKDWNDWNLKKFKKCIFGIQKLLYEDVFQFDSKTLNIHQNGVLCPRSNCIWSTINIPSGFKLRKMLKNRCFCQKRHFLSIYRGHFPTRGGVCVYFESLAIYSATSPY